MENQVQQLKLNAENIRSVLVSSNKTISKLKIKKKNIENKQLKLKKREEREKKIEAKSSFLKSSARNINKSIPSYDVLENIYGFIPIFFSKSLIKSVLNRTLRPILKCGIRPCLTFL